MADESAVSDRGDERVSPSASSSGQATPVEAVDETGAAVSDRMRKLQDLRKRMNDSTRANRKDVVAEAKRSHTTARESARLERKRARAEALGEKASALETGEDLERQRAWDYSIEDNDRWEKKLKRKKARAEFEFTDYNDVARRKYKKDIDKLKPDLAAYKRLQVQERSQEAADALSATSSAVAAPSEIYRDLNTFAYADHKPSDDAIDRVVGQLNADIDKRNKLSRTRPEEDGDVTYINDKNKVFNRKIARYYDKYTAETRANFERGTAL